MKWQLHFCFVLCALFFIAAESNAQQQTALLKDDKTIIYELPTAASRKIAQLPKGTKVTLLQRKGRWLQLTFGRGRTGWMAVSAKSVSAPDGAVPEAGSEPDLRRDLSNREYNAPGGLSLHLGFLGGDFTYLLKFFYKSRPRLHLEGSFQFVADKVLSIYVMDANFKYLWRGNANHVSWLNGGVGVLTSVPVKSAGAKSISNMAFNYGIGIQKPLKQTTHLRFDLRQFLVFTKNGLSGFLEFSAGLTIDIGKK